MVERRINLLPMENDKMRQTRARGRERDWNCWRKRERDLLL